MDKKKWIALSSYNKNRGSKNTMGIGLILRYIIILIIFAISIIITKRKKNERKKAKPFLAEVIIMLSLFSPTPDDDINKGIGLFQFLVVMTYGVYWAVITLIQDKSENEG